MKNKPTYSSWIEMRRRCRATNRENSGSYSERGIAVCERWESFANFHADMGDRPEGMTLDRIENDKGYEPGNCRWATPIVQQNNRRGVRLVPVECVLMPLAEACRLRGISHSTAAQRFDAGWPIDRVLDGPGARAKPPGRPLGRRLRELCDLLERLGEVSPKDLASHTDMDVHRYLARAKKHGVVFAPARGRCAVVPNWKNLPLWTKKA